MPHSTATIEAFVAWIKAQGVLQPPVVEIERRRRDRDRKLSCHHRRRSQNFSKAANKIREALAADEAAAGSGIRSD